MRRINVLGSEMAYVAEGEGPVVVFLHGNPTSSFAWRNVLPLLTDRARCLAPDLIGMGQSDRPDIPYRFSDHARYLDAWIEAMHLESVVLVGTDWGGALAMDWAARHPDRVRGLVVFETFMRPVELLARLREIPIDGEPSDVHATVEAYDRWLAASASVPKLLLTFDAPSRLGSPEIVAWAREHVSGLDVVALGRAGHHATEDDPVGIGHAIRAWLARHGLTRSGGVGPIGSYVRVDTFRAPAEARSRLLETSRQILAFLSSLDGFVGSSVLERRSGASGGDVITLVVWRSRDAADAAGPRVREFARANGLDVPKLLSDLGVEMSRTDYEVTSTGP